MKIKICIDLTEKDRVLLLKSYKELGIEDMPAWQTLMELLLHELKTAIQKEESS